MVDHRKSTKRKKHHDKDKYYRLAKEQGLRSRAAFKLSQINRRYSFLEKSRVILDLCAAPGGWTQIASRVCGHQSQIVAVDILPIRNLGSRNITTIVGDITTDQCKSEINRAITTTTSSHSGRNRTTSGGGGGGTVDVVLHDGAPNVGASYEKDAYEQLELSVHALRCATHHLKRGGTFVTKIYRSRDSTSFQWVVQQLFGSVESFKPKASRPQSAEIFVVCQDYLQPDKIDPRLLDPKHIFEVVEGDTTGGGGGGSGSSNFHVFHKNWDKSNKRQRGGYDLDNMDFAMRKILPVSEFVRAKGKMDAIRLLSTCTAFNFTSTHCQSYLHHPLTTPEIKECLTDLKVLNKGDFKGLMIWRERMSQVETEDDQSKTDDEDSDDNDEAKDDDTMNSEQEEEEIQNEIQQLKDRKRKERKRKEKKERALASKKRRQAALGMDLNAIEIQEQDRFFSLSLLESHKDLERVQEVNLDVATDEQVFGKEDDDDDDDGSDDEIKANDNDDEDENAQKLLRLEQELDGAYDRYLATTKNGLAKSGTKAAKRSKKLLREKMAQESHQDAEMLLAGAAGKSKDAVAYAKLLTQGKDDDSDDNDSGSSDDEDDGYHDTPMTPREYAAKKMPQQQQKQNEQEKNPLIHQFPDDPATVKTARWFSNPLFASIGRVAESATTNNGSTPSEDMDTRGEDDDEDVIHGEQDNVDDQANDSSESREQPTKGKKKKTRKPMVGLDADDVLAMIPKSDKQIRHEKRLKALARDERRQARKAKKMGDTAGDFEVAAIEQDDDENEEERDIQNMQGISDAKKQKLLQARRLIKAGMGSNSLENKNNGGFEVVEQERPLPVMDNRKYDSENEDYDSDDYAKTMALGTMMLRKSKQKSLVDASYNRFAWNDPQNLPEWFVDDENKHYRPQLPIPPALLAKMKEKMAALSTKPIAKVAEARARKNRKAKLKLADAKKKAQAVANSSEMSEAMKLKSISKALRSSDKNGAGKKEYVVAKKGLGNRGVRGATMVDKRMKNDKRAMERAGKKRKGGKKGGLTGSKRRRHHS